MSFEEYQVSYSGAIKKKLKAIFLQAEQLGVLDNFRNAALVIDHRLRTNPDDFGELKSYLKHMDLKIQIGFARPLMVEFGIQDNAKIVFVKRIEVV